MKKTSTLLSIGILLMAGTMSAQTWCTPTTAIPYASTMPGITQFTMNTINRSSADIENYPNNSYVNTGMSTNLTPGSTYTVTIGYTIDASICPDMNLRVWIDFNQDGALDDPGEEVITANNQTSLTYTGSFMVPTGATSGTTRCRVTAKMTSNGGHSLPTPCDVPVDQLGYHGEFEDYDVIIGPVGISELPLSPVSFVSVSPNPMTDGNAIVNYSLGAKSGVKIVVYNTMGQQVEILEDAATKPAGTYSVCSGELLLNDGLYFITIFAGNAQATQRLIVKQE